MCQGHQGRTLKKVERNSTMEEGDVPRALRMDPKDRWECAQGIIDGP